MVRSELAGDAQHSAPAHRPKSYAEDYRSIEISGAHVNARDTCEQGQGRTSKPAAWASILAVAFVASLGMVALLEMSAGYSTLNSEPVVMLSTAHVRHVKHRGSKYSEELDALAKRAGPDRRQALKNLEQLKLRSEGKQVHVKGGSKRGEPAALREMEHLAHRRAHDSKSSADGLGQLERSHGIKSSKDMLAEIMSLRHYKKNNQEIKNIANGFETHSSFSHKVQDSINRDEAQSRAQESKANRKSEASALRLEAGRVSRNEMMRETEGAAEKKLGAVLTKTLKPIQALLKRDEVTLDDLVSPTKVHANEDAIADAATRRTTHVLTDDLDADVKSNIKQREIALEHKSRQYLTKVHAKVKAALTKVVNPDTVRDKTNTTAKTSAASPWSSKVEKFLANTEKFMSKHAGSWLGMSTGPTVSHKAEETVIAATKKNLENQLRSEEAAVGTASSSSTHTSATAAGRSHAALGPAAAHAAALGPQPGPSAPVRETVPGGRSSAAVEAAKNKLEAKKHAQAGAAGAISSKTKKSWIKALNSYL